MSPLLAKRLSDESLGSRLASGEAAAFDELYRRYVHRLAAYGAHLLGDGAAGDDVAQAALLKAYSALRDGRVPDRMRPWLYRIAHNVAIDLVVRRREWPTAELPEQGAIDAAPVAGALVAALASLPERQRRVYVLRELHGLRIDETAAELSLSAAQVEQSLFAARNRLAEHLVFGDKLNCVSVQRLAAGPLDGDERRALKSHLRSCVGCRNGLGLRGRALSVLPVTSLDWLRGLVAGATGGGAPVAAKVGAAVATVTFAAGVPAAVETVQVHRLPVHVVRISQRQQQPARHEQATNAPLRSISPLRFVATPIAAAAVSNPKPAEPRDDRGSGDNTVTTGVAQDGHGDGGGDAPATVSSSDGSGESGRTTTTTTEVTAPVPTSDGSGSDELGSDGGGSGDSGATSGSGDGGGGTDGGSHDGGGGDGGGSGDPLTGTVPAASD